MILLICQQLTLHKKTLHKIENNNIRGSVYVKSMSIKLTELANKNSLSIPY